MIHAVFPGTFDPLTFGHLNIIERAARLFDKLTVIVAENRQKILLFTVEERIVILQKETAIWANVFVERCDSLVVHFMKAHHAKVIVRGLRNSEDFSYEAEIARINRILEPYVETCFLISDPSLSIVSSSAVREILHFGGDISTLVPQAVLLQLQNRPILA
ncbi:MAG: pantetheine-phosphate adenylyltransferase [Treponema sp.]|jgi:pantetheine-phosphate adenylyltransferase|nr:pantetheine-phosphate adenylyltransferase [Treponema sp.]